MSSLVFSRKIALREKTRELKHVSAVRNNGNSGVGKCGTPHVRDVGCSAGCEKGV